MVNPDAAANLREGAIVDGIGNALFGELTFKDGQPGKQNFDQYRMIRMSEAPSFAALANALYQVKGQRLYEQPVAGQAGLL